MLERKRPFQWALGPEILDQAEGPAGRQPVPPHTWQGETGLWGKLGTPGEALTCQVLKLRLPQWHQEVLPYN